MTNTPTTPHENLSAIQIALNGALHAAPRGMETSTISKAIGAAFTLEKQIKELEQRAGVK